MVESTIGDTITKITERMSYLCVFGKKITTVTENIKRYLFDIKEVSGHRHDATPTPDWLIDVSDAVTDLGDLLDDQDLPADAALLPKQTKITSFSSLYKLTATRRSLLLQLEQIEKRLQNIAGDLTKLWLKNSKRLRNSNSKDKEIEIVGREDYKEDIIGRILALTKVKGAVTILGMQGIGKTRLAKMVCEDERVKRNFDLVIWIDGIHAESYAESIVEYMIHESESKKKKRRRRKQKKKKKKTKKKKKLELQEKDPIVIDENFNLGEAMSGNRFLDENFNLGEAMSGNRFLLVLDDLRSENREEWLKLQKILAASLSDGAILVTTQNSLVANVVYRHVCTLKELSEEDSWTLFEQVVGGGGPSESKIRDTQKKMVSKCRGVPLAILTMARLLRSREAITESEIDHLEEEFMQEMKLIYYEDLPSSHLKQLFAYLSLFFSTTKSVKAEKLIRLWMAEGFLGPVRVNSNYSSSCSPQQPQEEDLLLGCIQELGRRSILRVYENKYGILTNCSMHYKLMLKLSRFVAGKDHFYVDDVDEDVKGTVHRVALTNDFDVSNGILKSLFANKKNLRTLLCDGQSSRIPGEVKLSWSACDAVFCAFKCLRVLKLTNLGMKMLPASIGEMKILRYLDLSGNDMKKLPNSIGKLKHLQTLILSYCHQLRELPSEMKQLVNLKHLEIEECLRLTHMPSGLKKLTNLERLSNFVVSISNNKKHILGFRELANLNNLRWKLEISHLERLQKVMEFGQAKHAYLKEKRHLKCLGLKWNHDDEDNNNDSNHDEKSLGPLEPHQDLQELRIVGYKGAEFSAWFSRLGNLVGLILYDCPMCKSLPPLNQFPKLKFLELKRLDSLEYVTDQDDGCNELGLGLLENLSISDCPKLTSWWKGRTHNNAILFGSIKNLEVNYCPKLDCMPLFPNLDYLLELQDSSMKPLLQTIKYTSASNSRILSNLDSISNSSLPLSKLLNLSIKNVEEESLLPEDWLKNFFCLEYLRISEKMSRMKGFKHLSSLTYVVIIECTGVDLPSDEWEGLRNLRYLAIGEIDKLQSLPEGIKHLTSLTELRIVSCPELTTLTEGIGHLKSVKCLWIYDCHKLASLPKEMSKLRSLNELAIRDCPLLLPRCQKETGDDWPQIKHINDIRLEGTSEIYE